MGNHFDQVCEQSEKANELLKKIETILAQSRHEIVENLKIVDEMTSNQRNSQ